MKETVKSSLDPKAFPGNSNKERKEKIELKAVVTDKAKIRKKSFSQKAGELFVGEEIDNVWSYIVTDVVVPATKNLISDMVSQGINMFLFGGTTPLNRGGFGNQRGRGQVTDYAQFSSLHQNRMAPSARNRALHSFDDIVFSTRADAEMVAQTLLSHLHTYGEVAVADFYILADITPNFTDNNSGWTNLDDISVSQIRGGGYIVNLPRTRGL